MEVNALIRVRLLLVTAHVAIETSHVSVILFRTDVQVVLLLHLR